MEGFINKIRLQRKLYKSQLNCKQNFHQQKSKCAKKIFVYLLFHIMLFLTHVPMPKCVQKSYTNRDNNLYVSLFSLLYTETLRPICHWVITVQSCSIFCNTNDLKRFPFILPFVQFCHFAYAGVFLFFYNEFMYLRLCGCMFDLCTCIWIII